MTLDEIKRRIMFLKLEIQKLLGKKVDWIIVHHAAGDWSFGEVNHEHTTRWNFISTLGYGMGYTYWIDKMGSITQARHDLEEGAHCIGVNKNSIGICLQGNFDIKKPTEYQLNALKGLLDKKKAEYNLVNKQIEGHKFFANKSCPGKFLYQWLCKNYPS